MGRRPTWTYCSKKSLRGPVYTTGALVSIQARYLSLLSVWQPWKQPLLAARGASSPVLHLLLRRVASSEHRATHWLFLGLWGSNNLRHLGLLIHLVQWQCCQWPPQGLNRLIKTPFQTPAISLLRHWGEEGAVDKTLINVICFLFFQTCPLVPHLLCDPRADYIGAATICSPWGQKFGYIIQLQAFIELIGEDFRD